MDISKTKIVIATHYLVYGAPQALREYLMEKKVHSLFIVSHPLQNDATKSKFEIVKRGKTKKEIISPLRTRLQILNYLIEPIVSLFWFLKFCGSADLFIGVDPLNCILGVFLKEIGRTKKLVYYTIDYVPNRFSSSVLNNFYHFLDRMCVSNADETWNVSERIAQGREKIRGLSQKQFNNQKVVPIGVWLDRVKRLPFDRIKKHQLLFIGNLLEKQGVQLVLEAMPDVLKKIPDFHFLIVGGGEYEDNLKKMVKKLKLEKSVTFTGWIKERNTLDNLMSDSAMAIAMYDKEKDNFTYYADPTKLKDYLSAGLPILLTDVPHNAQELENKRCAYIVKYDRNSISKAIISIMKNTEKLKEYRRNSLIYIRQFTWKKVFDRALKNL